jgi:hypothetical protein
MKENNDIGQLNTKLAQWLADTDECIRVIPADGGKYSNGRPGFVAALTRQEWLIVNLPTTDHALTSIAAEAWGEPEKFRALLIAYVRWRALSMVGTSPFDSPWHFTDPLLALAAGDARVWAIQAALGERCNLEGWSFSGEELVWLVTMLIIAIEHDLPAWPPAWRNITAHILAEAGKFDRALAETLLALHASDADPLPPFEQVIAGFRHAQWARTRYGALSALPLLPIGIVELARRKNPDAAERLSRLLPLAAADYVRTLTAPALALPFRFSGQLSPLNTLLDAPETWPEFAAGLRRKMDAEEKR